MDKNLQSPLSPLSFDALYRRLYHRAFCFTQSYIHDALIAEDLASEALIKLWEQIGSECPVACPEALLVTILKNKALDYLKHEAIKENAFKELRTSDELQMRISLLEACDPQDIFVTEIHEIVQDTLTRFPEQTRLIFTMSQFGNKSNKEIAGMLGLSVKSIEYHITKVLKALRITLRDYLPLFICILYTFIKKS
ncbi:MAG: RNA polymerase sigma-70 factor [Tannerellaceae bacterium]|jgi:RNA polymerase sigma-70 factor (ECF subfamily)|nr:RNA polymerase sigma-70 factor [Tannerellaceae bacterium]